MNYLESVEMFKTKDGSLFTSESKANDYIVNDICEELNEIFKKLDLLSLRHSDLVKIITALSGDIKAIDRLYSILDKHV